MPPSARRKTAPAAATDQPKPPPFLIRRPEPAAERDLNVLLYGPPGYGKTTSAASAVFVPAMRDVLFISAESGEMSISGARWKAAGLDIVRINKYPQIARLYEFLRKHVLARDTDDEEALLALQQKYLDPEQVDDLDRIRRYRTVIIDSLNEVQKYNIYQLTGIDLGRAPLDVEPDVPEQRDWLHSTEMIRLLIRSFRDLPMHVIIVCAEEEVTDAKGRVIKAQLALTPKLVGEVPGFMDLVGYMEKKMSEAGPEVRMYLGAGHARFTAKHRFENLPDLDYIELGDPQDAPPMAQLIELDRKNEELNRNARSTAAAPQGRIRTRSRNEEAAPASGTRAGVRGRGGRAVRRGGGAAQGQARPQARRRA